MRGRAIVWILFALAAAGYGAVNAAPHQQNTASPKEATQTRHYFDNDPRLDTKMTINSRACTHLTLWREITRWTRVPIDREQGASEFDDVPLVLAGHRVPARAIMDAVAARIMARWERMERDGYRFLVPQGEADRGFNPYNEHERERFRIGAGFIRDFHALSQESQKRLLQGPVPFTDLPVGMQQAVAGMLASLSHEWQEQKGRGTSVQPHQLSAARFRLDRKPAHGFNRYFITVSVQNVGSTGWRLNDYEMQEAARRQKRKAGEYVDIYLPRKFEVSQEKAKRLSALQQTVELDAQNITLPGVLLQLHEKYGIPFVCDPEREMPQRADVNLSRMTLGEALDRLMELYPNTEWEWRKYGVMVVRGPLNPARDRKPPADKTSARHPEARLQGSKPAP